MQEFATKAGDELAWRQPKSGLRYYELFRGEEAFGTLEFRSLWGTLAIARNPIQDWSFKRMGFLNPHITIRHPEADSDYALFFPKVFGGGTLQMLDGRSFAWEALNFWRTRWRFNDKSGADPQFRPGQRRTQDHRFPQDAGAGAGREQPHHQPGVFHDGQPGFLPDDPAPIRRSRRRK